MRCGPWTTPVSGLFKLSTGLRLASCRSRPLGVTRECWWWMILVGVASGRQREILSLPKCMYALFFNYRESNLESLG